MSASNQPVTRRQAIQSLSAGAITLAGVSLFAMSNLTAATANSTVQPAPLGFDLPPLPYALDALEPYLDAKTLEIHHDKHHAAYITNAKKLLDSHPELLALGAQGLLVSLDRVPEAIRTGVRNNVGGHVNHTFFWPLLAAPVTYQPGALQAEIAKTFGSLAEFQKQFGAAAASRFGSGWAWLSVKPGSGLVIHSTPNQDSPLTDGLKPVIGLDVWEHAYYLKYQNRRADYIAAFWSLLNWNQAEANYRAAVG